MQPIRAWWDGLTFGTRHPARRVAVLTTTGAICGLAESAVVVLVVHLASMNDVAQELPITRSLPGDARSTAAIALAVIGLLAAAHLVSARLSALVAADTERTVRRRLVASFLDAPWSAQVGERASELQQLMMSNAGQLAVGAQQAALALGSGINLAVLSVTAIAISPWSTLGVVAVAVLALAVVRPFRARTRRIARSASSTSAELAAELGETVHLAREIAVFDVRSAAQHRLDRLVDRAADQLQAVRTASAAVPALSRDLTVAVIVLALAAVARSSSTSLAVLGATAALLLRALNHAQVVSGVAHRLTERSAHLERLVAGLTRWDRAEVGGARRLDGLDVIELEDVGYTYGGSHRPALRAVTLRVEHGEQVGIIGRTGAGKTTLAGVLLGVLAPGSGTARVNGIDVAEVEPSAWRSLVAWVPQEPRLLSGTVADNVRFLREDLDDEAVLDAVTRAGLAEEVCAWPDGIAHDVGIGGQALSGGQRQRVALARALAGRPRLLVLDEPTSALDGFTERAVREALARLRGDVTVVVIAHRLSTLDGCDRVLVLEDGALVEDAPPTELARTSSYYREVLAIAGA